MNPVLKNILKPLSEFYADPSTIEVRMGKPCEVITDRRGKGLEIHEAPNLNQAQVEKICASLANHASIYFDASMSPKLSCILPDQKHRFECLVGASVQTGLSMAIRCKHPFSPSWEQFGVGVKTRRTPNKLQKAKLIKLSNIKEYLIYAMTHHYNMIVSGATNTGKTTLLNMLLAFLPEHARVVAVEDTPELQIDRFWNGVGLVASREESRGQSGMVSWRELYDHTTRITPDQIIFGEISTSNAFAALGLLNSGISGFACTLHAASPEQALDRKFDQNTAWAGTNMPRIPEFLRELIDVVIQIKRNKKGIRRITDIYEPIKDYWVMKDCAFKGNKP